MPRGWEGNRRSGVALAMRHRLKWFLQLRADGLRKGDERPAYMYTPHGVQHTLPTDAAGGAATGDTGRRSLTSLSADAEYFWFLLIVMSTAADLSAGCGPTVIVAVVSTAIRHPSTPRQLYR